MNNHSNNRQSLRLKNYDYSQQGLYFITICSNKMVCLFGDISNDIMHLNNAGLMIETQWLELKNRFKHISIHDFVVMPNHFHGIIEIIKPDKNLAEMIGAFKSITTNAYINGVKDNQWEAFDHKLWKRNYYEHVIRNEQSHHKISQYIQYNPSKWCDDKFFVN